MIIWQFIFYLVTGLFLSPIFIFICMGLDWDPDDDIDKVVPAFCCFLFFYPLFLILIVILGFLLALYGGKVVWDSMKKVYEKIIKNKDKNKE